MAKRSLDFNEPQSTPKKKSKEATEQLMPLSPTDITSTDRDTTINGIIACLSPVRPSKYFDGELTDGNTIIRFVGFRKEQQRRLHSYCEQKQPITLKNCEVQLNKFNHQLEILLKNDTQIEMQFSVPDMKTVGSQEIQLNELSEQDEYDKVTIKAQVIKVNEPQKFGPGKLKQEVIIADSTATAKLMLWESDVNMLLETKSYQMRKLVVRSYLQKNYLSVPSTGSTIEETDYLENVIAEPESSSDDDEFLAAVTVAGVQQLEAIYTCINCKKGIPAALNETMATCDNCKTMQKMSTKRQTAKLFNDNSQQHIALRAHDDFLKAIAQTDGQINSEDLLFAPPFDIKYNKYHVITHPGNN